MKQPAIPVDLTDEVSVKRFLSELLNYVNDARKEYDSLNQAINSAGDSSDQAIKNLTDLVDLVEKLSNKLDESVEVNNRQQTAIDDLITRVEALESGSSPI